MMRPNHIDTALALDVAELAINHCQFTEPFRQRHIRDERRFNKMSIIDTAEEINDLFADEHIVKLRRIVEELVDIGLSAIGVVVGVHDSFEQLVEEQWNIASERKRVRVIPVANRHELLLPNQILVGVERAPEPDTNGRLRHLVERLIVSRRQSDDGGTQL